jgi:hypothetical protein
MRDRKASIDEKERTKKVGVEAKQKKKKGQRWTE